MFACCNCPVNQLVPFLDRRVKVVTKCGEITGILRAIGETFIEVEESDHRFVLTVIQCAVICYVSLLK